MGEEEFQGRLPGIHLEGPFISPLPGAVGAHRPDCTLPPDPDDGILPADLDGDSDIDHDDLGLFQLALTGPLP